THNIALAGEMDQGDPGSGLRLHEHGHQVREQDHQEQVVAKPAATLNVGGEVTGVDVDDAGDKRGTEERQPGSEAAPSTLQGCIPCAFQAGFSSHNQPCCSAMRAASTRFCAPSFWIASDR